MNTAQPGSDFARARADARTHEDARPPEDAHPREGTRTREDARPRQRAITPSRPRSCAAARLGALALASALTAACATAHATVPLFHAQGAYLGHPPADSIRNANGSSRAIAPADYAAFRRDIEPRLREWARDERLGLNPAFVAALLAKESAFNPRAVSPTGAVGIAQLTTRADTDLRTRAGTPFFAWMLPEIQGWPRDSAFRAPADAASTVHAAQRLAAAPDAPQRDYLFNAVLATRAAVFWLRMLEAIWTTDTWPGAYGSVAREKLNGGNPLGEQQLLELAVVSYNSGVEYVRGLVEQWGPTWTQHLDAEPADYLERITTYTLLFQR